MLKKLLFSCGFASLCGAAAMAQPITPDENGLFTLTIEVDASFDGSLGPVTWPREYFCGVAHMPLDGPQERIACGITEPFTPTDARVQGYMFIPENSQYGSRGRNTTVVLWQYNTETQYSGGFIGALRDGRFVGVTYDEAHNHADWAQTLD